MVQELWSNLFYFHNRFRENTKCWQPYSWKPKRLENWFHRIIRQTPSMMSLTTDFCDGKEYREQIFNGHGSLLSISVFSPQQWDYCETSSFVLYTENVTVIKTYWEFKKSFNFGIWWQFHSQCQSFHHKRWSPLPLSYHRGPRGMPTSPCHDLFKHKGTLAGPPNLHCKTVPFGEWYYKLFKKITRLQLNIPTLDKNQDIPSRI